MDGEMEAQTGAMLPFTISWRGGGGLPVRALVSVIVNVQIIARQFGYGWLWLDGETAFQ